MSYLDLILRSITEPGLLRAFVRFLLDTEKFDGERILDALVERLNSPDANLCMVTMALFDTLLGLHCEDLMLELLLKFMLPGKHVPISHRHKINKIDPYLNSSEFFLELSPDVMKRARDLARPKRSGHCSAQVERRGRGSTGGPPIVLHFLLFLRGLHDVGALRWNHPVYVSSSTCHLALLTPISRCSDILLCPGPAALSSGPASQLPHLHTHSDDAQPAPHYGQHQNPRQCHPARLLDNPAGGALQVGAHAALLPRQRWQHGTPHAERRWSLKYTYVFIITALCSTF